MSRDYATNKRVLESERICSKHFVFGEPAPNWDQFHVDWVPTVALGKKKYVEKDHENAAKRALRAKKGQQAINPCTRTMDRPCFSMVLPWLITVFNHGQPWFGNGLTMV